MKKETRASKVSTLKSPSTSTAEAEIASSFEGKVFSAKLEELPKLIAGVRDEIQDVIKPVSDSNLTDKREDKLKAKLKDIETISRDKYAPLLSRLTLKLDKSTYKYSVKLFNDLAEMYISVGKIKQEIKFNLDNNADKQLFAATEHPAKRIEEIQKIYDDKIKTIDFMVAYTDSAICYQHLLAVIRGQQKDKLNAVDADTSWFTEQFKIPNPYLQLNQVQQLIVEAARSTSATAAAVTASEVAAPIPKIESQTTNDTIAERNILELLRNQAKEDVVAINKYKNDPSRTAEYIKCTRASFEHSAKGMQEYLARIFTAAEEVLGKAPCEYSVIGLGSMALNQITPYSDLEFAILTANEDYKLSADAKVRSYFKNLSHYAHFKVICLGETVIPTSKYGVDTSTVVPVAVNFDLGGKTSLGRLDKDKPYDLIKTVEYMLRYLKNEEGSAEHIDKNLPYILEKVCHVYGQDELTTTYTAAVAKFMQEEVDTGEVTGEAGSKVKRCELRAKKVMLDGATELDYSPGINYGTAKLKTIGDLEKFGSSLNQAAGVPFNVKQEIYRLPDRLLYNLGSYFGIHGDGVWDTIDQLEAAGIINATGANNLRYAASFATSLRLSTYSHYDCQREKMSILSTQAHRKLEHIKLGGRSKEIELYNLAEEDLQEGGALFKYYYTAIPLIANLKEFFNKPLKEAKVFAATDEEFYDPTAKNKTIIFYRLQNFQKILQYAQEHLKTLKITKASSNADHLEQTEFLKYTGYALYLIGKYELALEKHEQALVIRQEIFGDKSKEVAISLNNIGMVLHSMGKYEEALEKYEEALAIQKEIFGDKSKEVAGSLNNIAGVLQDMGKYELALEKHEQALGMSKEILGDKSKEVAISLNNIGMVLHAMGKYKDALEKQEQTFGIRKEIFGDKSQEVATPLNNIGMVLHAMGKYEDALEKYEQALAMKKAILGDKSKEVASSLNNIAGVLQDMGKYELALERHEQALVIRKAILGANSKEVATSLNNMASVLKDMGKYEDALEKHEQAFAIWKEIFGEKSKEVAISLNNIGMGLHAMGKYKDALEKHEQAFEIRKEILGDKSKEVADSLHNIGLVLHDMGKYKDALAKHEQALAINTAILGDKSKEVATSLNNIASVLHAMGKYEDALEKYEQALAIDKEILDDKSREEAASLNNMANVLHAMGKYEDALEKHEQALAIDKAILGANSKEVATSLNNIGLVLQDMGKDKQALEKYEQSLAINTAIFGDKSKEVATSLYNIASVLDAMGKNKQALEKHEQALAMYKTILGANSKEVAGSLYNIAYVLHDIGKYAESKTKCFAALKICQALPQEGIEIKQIKTFAHIMIKQIITIEEQNKKAASKELPSLADASLTNYTKEVPAKHKGEVRVLSYNIAVDFFDNKDETVDARHHWKHRKPYVEKLLKTPMAIAMDVLCLQELSPQQGLDIVGMLGKNYLSIFLAQTPSEIKAGIITYGQGIKAWLGKFIGTPLIAICVNKKQWKIADDKADKFWLKETPDLTPKPELMSKEEFDIDRKDGKIDKGFGNMNTYRAVLWVKLVNKQDTEQEFFVFNSHYPLSGGNKTRLKCAQLELQKIKEITKGAPWVSTGDRNLVPDGSDTMEYNPEIAYQALVGPYEDIRFIKKHYGSHATWLGFSFDKYKSHIKSGDVVPALGTEKATVLDVMISNKPAKFSFHYPVAYTPAVSSAASTDKAAGALGAEVLATASESTAAEAGSGKLLAISIPLPDSLAADRYFASDHALIGADFDLFG